MTLLKQEQSVSTVKIGGIDRRLRFLSHAKPVWVTDPDPDGAALEKPNPSATQDNHAGYYFDLDASERVISDVIIRNKLLLVTGFTPNNDRCGPGGNSMFMEINAFTGGSTGGSLFDITGDRKIDAKPGDLAASGIEFFGNIQPPAILGLPGKDSYDMIYLSSSTGKIEQIPGIGPKLGVAYWMEIHY